MSPWLVPLTPPSDADEGEGWTERRNQLSSRRFGLICSRPRARAPRRGRRRGLRRCTRGGGCSGRARLTREEASRRHRPIHPRPSTTSSSACGRSMPPCPTRDGVAWFNKLYLRVTERVKHGHEQGAFRSPGFLERRIAVQVAPRPGGAAASLDVVFADLYFRACELAEAGDPRRCRRRGRRSSPPGRPRDRPDPVRARRHERPHQLRLPVGLVQTCTELGLEVDTRTPHHADFEQVDELLEEVEDEVSTGSRQASSVSWTTRSAAPTTSSRCGRCREPGRRRGRTPRSCRRSAGHAADRFLSSHGRLVGAFGRALLLPIGETLT
jgi:hypothetical protein